MAAAAIKMSPYIVHVIRRDIEYNTANVGIGLGLSIGSVPAGAMVTDIWLGVTQLFNAGASTVDVGYVNNEGELTAKASSPGDALEFTKATVTAARDSSNIEYFIRYTYTGGAPTAGRASALIFYILDQVA